MLTYHQAAAALLDHPLTVSPPAVALLNERERNLGIRFPAAVREWYSLEGAVAMLEAYSNHDHPIPIVELGRVEKGYVGNPDRDLLAQGLLLLVYENQTATGWAVRLDGSDDPPVLAQEDWPRGPWRPYAERFSTFVYTWVWDWQTGLAEQGCRLMCGTAPITPADQAVLQEQYQEGPRTYTWPTPITYRFFSPDGHKRIQICAGTEMDAHGGWLLWADTKDALRELTRSVWVHGDLATTLTAFENPCGAMVLEELGRTNAWINTNLDRDVTVFVLENDLRLGNDREPPLPWNLPGRAVSARGPRPLRAPRRETATGR